MELKTPEQIAAEVHASHTVGASPGIVAESIREWMTLAIEADREQIIEEMRVRSHPDDWGVPCIYIDTFTRRLRGTLEDNA